MSDEINDDVEQSALFDVDPDWKDLWEGMPSYEHQDLQPYQSLIVHFRDMKDREAFGKLIDQPLTTKTKSIWHPRVEIRKASDKVFTGGQGSTPRYPIYIISKGRWESRLTAKSLEWIKVPYHIVIEPQEYAQYAAVIDPKKILTLPFSNLGLGGIPARNWVYEHAVATGADRHWILDDNISGFCRFHDNLKVEVDSGATFCAVEDWVDRYENVAMAAFNYDYFAPRKMGAKIKPITINTRCYSGILLSNKVPHRWRGRYNEDTDLSLRLLKDGYCTALFNAFLMYKKPTMKMKGGNTDELYAGKEAAQEEWEAHAKDCSACKRCTDGYGSEVQPCADGLVILEKDGRWRMAEHLRAQHPDVTSVERKWGRWQHVVDYRRFKDNQLILREGVEIKQNDYGMVFDAMPEGWGAMGHDKRNSLDAPALVGKPEPSAAATPSPQKQPSLQAKPEPGAAPGPSALGFALARKSAPEQPKPVSVIDALRKKEPVAPPAVVVPQASWSTSDVIQDADGIRIWLTSRGYKVVRTADAFTIEDADSWASDDFAWFCNLNADVIRDAAQSPAPIQAPPVDPRDCESDVSVGQREESQGAVAQETPPSSHEDRSPDDDGPGNAGPNTTVVSPASDGGVVPIPEERRNLGAYDAPKAGAGLEPADPQPITEDAGLLGFNAGTFFDEPVGGQSLAQFLGSEPPRVTSTYVPDEPPDLTGIDEVVLNFATDGLDWIGGNRPGGVTVSSMDGQLCRFLPFRFLSGNLDEGQVKRWAQEQLRNKKIYNAKTKFDVHMAWVWGVDLEAQGCRFSDIQHTAALLDDHTKRVGLDVLQPIYLPDLPPVARVDERRHLEHHAAEVAERERYTAGLVWRLRDAMYPEIDKQELRAVQDLEDSVIPAVVEMEKNGSPIDMELLERYGRECTAEHGRLMMEVSQEAGFAFEHTDKGWTRLIEHLRLTVPDSFSEAVLNEVDHPLIRKGQKAKQYAQLNSKIFDAYPAHIRDGILRYEINQLASDDGGTRSGRFSIGIVQQVPNAGNHKAAFGDELFPRRLFIPGAGRYLEADAAQIEFRLLVHYSGNKALLQAYRNDPKMSFHRAMQTKLQTYKPNMLYEHTKAYNFAAQYGARSIKLAIMMGFITEREGAEIRQAKRWDDPRLNLIKEIETAYKQAHPEAGELLDRAGHLAKSKCDEYCRKGDKLHREFQHRGFVKTLVGRRSRFPTNFKTYIGLNRVLQGSGADIMKQKLVELHDARKDTGFVMRITNHDAVLGDALTPETDGKVATILDKQSFPLKVPIIWEVGTGGNWAECK